MNNAADFPIFYYLGDRQGSCLMDRPYHWVEEAVGVCRSPKKDWRGVSSVEFANHKAKPLK
jgi:hypothetical protein